MAWASMADMAYTGAAIRYCRLALVDDDEFGDLAILRSEPHLTCPGRGLGAPRIVGDDGVTIHADSQHVDLVGWRLRLVSSDNRGPALERADRNTAEHE